MMAVSSLSRYRSALLVLALPSIACSGNSRRFGDGEAPELTEHPDPAGANAPTAGSPGRDAGDVGATGGSGGMNAPLATGGMEGGTTDGGATGDDAGMPHGSLDAGRDASMDAGVDSGMDAAAAPPGSIAGGPFAGLPGYTDTTATGCALIVRVVDGGTRLSLQASNLTADTIYPAHLHDAPCSQNAGGHYKIDAAVADTNESNELWAPLTTDANGRTQVEVLNAHQVRADGMSVVIHDPQAANAKMLCADLLVTDGGVSAGSEYVTSGNAVLLPRPTDAGVNSLSGTAQMTRRLDNTTEVHIELSGLKPGTQYPIHVHDSACAAASGGGHYRIDASVANTEEANEIWLTLTTDGTGAGTHDVVVGHLARAEAQSIVIHDTDSSRLACVDLKP